MTNPVVGAIAAEAAKEVITPAVSNLLKDVLAVAATGVDMHMIVQQVDEMEKDGATVADVHAWLKAQALESYQQLQIELGLK